MEKIKWGDVIECTSREGIVRKVNSTQRMRLDKKISATRRFGGKAFHTEKQQLQSPFHKNDQTRKQAPACGQRLLCSTRRGQRGCEEP